MRTNPNASAAPGGRAASMAGRNGERVVLADVCVSAVLQDALGEVAVAQTYRNAEDVNVEAVYTFPLPLDAVLLELEVRIGERALAGAVVERRQAETRYEDAIESGDAAVMLQAIEPGLYTMNVGNLLPGETVQVSMRYALVWRWADDRLRVLLPTTIAPRYGGSPHAPHQVPEASMTVEHRFSLVVEARGALRDAQFECPSHAVTLQRDDDRFTISLAAERAAMDRDFVLIARAPQSRRGFAIAGPDGEGLAALACLQRFFPGRRAPGALSLAIVVDCSGSRAGASIAQARRALDGILDAHEPRDRVAVVAFGSTARALDDAALPCTPGNVERARAFSATLDANMGGTEIAGALELAFASLSRTGPGDVLLITDGEVGHWQAVVDAAARSGHRVFTVGVGAAVSEAFLRGLAQATGGACELVSPNEAMADRIVRHAARLRAPRAKRAELHWPAGARDVFPPRIDAVFDGDTLVAWARFDARRIDGPVVLELETDDGQVTRQALAIEAPDGRADAAPAGADAPIGTVARLAAAARLSTLPDDARLAAALRYRLVSDRTHWLVVAERADADKATQLPELRKVEQMLAAGWGATGSVAARAPFARMADVAASFERLAAPPRRAAPRDVDADIQFSLRRQAPASPPAKGARRSNPRERPLADLFRSPDGGGPGEPTLPAGYRQLLDAIAQSGGDFDLALAPRWLQDAGVPEDFDALLRLARSAGVTPRALAARMLLGLLDGPLAPWLAADGLRVPDALRRFVEHVERSLSALFERFGALERTLDDARRGGIVETVVLADANSLLERAAAARALLQRADEAVELAARDIPAPRAVGRRHRPAAG
ncbi:MAG: VIT and VWA domain-containing protein [Burkholderiaceae bacterium]